MPFRKAKPLRCRAARSDASVRSIEKTISDKLKLPEGSIKIVNPSGKKFRSNETILDVLDAWRSYP